MARCARAAVAKIARLSARTHVEPVFEIGGWPSRGSGVIPGRADNAGTELRDQFLSRVGVIAEALPRMRARREEVANLEET